MEPVNIESIDCSISITWESPVSGGLEITDYRVEIKGSVVLFKEVPECTVDSCVISMTDLTLEPYELRQGDLIQIRAYAKNTNGWSEPSEFNTDEVYVNAALPLTINERPTVEELNET